jgi:hypothetical protein
MYPYLLYIMAQCEAERLKRQAQHSRLGYAIGGKTKESSVLRVIHWFSLVPRARWWKRTIRTCG